MTRNTAREIAMHLAFELSFTDLPIDAFLNHYLSAEKFEELATECDHPRHRHHPARGMPHSPRPRHVLRGRLLRWLQLHRQP